MLLQPTQDFASMFNMILKGRTEYNDIVQIHINLRVADLVDGGTKSPSVYGHSNCSQF